MLEHLRWCGLLKRSWPQALLARTCLARDSGAWPLAALVGIKGDGQGRLERLGQMASGWVSRPANTMTTYHRDTTMVHADEVVSKQLIRGSSTIDALSFHESRALRTRRRFVVSEPERHPRGRPYFIGATLVQCPHLVYCYAPRWHLSRTTEDWSRC